MILRGYIDESYNNKVFTLSCSMSDPANWLRFESAWRNCLRAKNKSLKNQGRTQISRYHAADCSSRVGDFKGWNVDEQIALTEDLLRVFRNCEVMNAICYSMPLDDFGRFFPECKEDLIEACYSELLKFMMLEISDQFETARQQLRPSGVDDR